MTDPRCLSCIRACFNQGIEICIDANFELVSADQFLKASRDMKLIKRDDAALPWFNPMKPRIMRALGHRKHADGIGAQHQFGSDAVGRKRPAAHGALCLWRSIHTARIQEMLEPMDVIKAILNI